MRERWLVLLAMFSLLHASCASLGQESVAPRDKQAAAASEAADLVEWNLQLSTYGGKQFWTDVEICEDCRIQCNVVTGHHRLLDDHDVRQTWGTLPKCQAKFTEIKRERSMVAPRGKVVIVLHGLLRSREQLQGLSNYLEQEGHYTVLNFGYASSRSEVGEHAAALASVVEGCRDADEISFVAHSLGNIVVRHYLADCTLDGKKLDPRIHRVVMLGPPNNGAELANRFRNNPLFQLVWGRSGK
ncbi:MAG TPA: hypothetical protein VL096_18265, partial [Pirellulaceae bacterium]|nr:hypothetical protein [Pirellulaceae bacterium]